MSAALSLAIARGVAAAEEFRWPAPPYFEFVREQDRFDWDSCLLIFRDDTRASGQLLRFVPGETLLTFRPDGAGETVDVDFSVLLKLQLRRPVDLQREMPPLAASESETLPQTESQPFRFHLANGEIFEGMTLGYVSALCGPFLYLPQANGGVVRCFVPEQAAEIGSIDAPIGQILINQKVVSPEAVGAALNLQATMRTQRFDRFLTQNTNSTGVSGAIPAVAAKRRRMLSVCDTQRTRGTVENDGDNAVMDKLRAMTQINMVPDTAPAKNSGTPFMLHQGGAANAAIAAPAVSLRKNRDSGTPRVANLVGRTEAGVHELISRLAAESGNQDIVEQQAAKSDSALVKLVNRIILDAVEQKASDIHIEANLGPKPTCVRFRKDGILVNYLDLPSQFCNAVVSRIKIMSQLDITERRKPQDGKVDFSRFGPAQVELRIATVPTTGGLEDVVMRLLVGGSPVPLAELGLDQEALESVQRLISKPHGLFLVCGPTGSGKTTTLHSLLAYPEYVRAKDLDGRGPDRDHPAGAAPGSG